MKIHFIIYDKVEELDLVGPWELVGLLAEIGLCESPRLISLNSMTPSGEHGMRFSADSHFSEAELPDVLIVPGGSGARSAMLDDEVIAFMQRAGQECQAILSICTGMYLMQRAGLFSGKKATTHWEFLNELKQDPTVETVEERFVKDGTIWSSAGVSAGMDMTLAFIADHFGVAVASTIQLKAEYYPSSKVYGHAHRQANTAEYIQKLTS
ncbi:DJ-1/PfpI family protein [uncultured Gilvimarinus sp.]|uniref:DJ-1/PfpI family protein n=1 Tax=uncultured Gilvimarinus sp. TaxID=1689143 RepID=UPI0030EC02B0|tara:strand:- start:1159 stop:1788 length:630 start_codon:yes stop_codon:yes gene_type:complete